MQTLFTHDQMPSWDWKSGPWEREQKICHHTHGFKVILLVSISHHKYKSLKMLGHTSVIQLFSPCKGRHDIMKKLSVKSCAELAAALPALLRWGNRQQVPLAEQRHSRVSSQGSERQIGETRHFKKWPSAHTDWLYGGHTRKKVITEISSSEG